MIHHVRPPVSLNCDKNLKMMFLLIHAHGNDFTLCAFAPTGTEIKHYKTMLILTCN